MATDATLTPTQRNEIFELIRKYGPPANEFTWDEEDHRWTLYMEGTRTHRVSVLRHRPTGYSCLFGDWVMVTCPGIVQKVETTAHEACHEKYNAANERRLRRLKDVSVAQDREKTTGSFRQGQNGKKAKATPWWLADF